MCEISKPLVTLGELGRRTGQPLWRLRRLFDSGDLGECIRLGPTRAVRAAEVEKVLERIAELTSEK
jgi:hypothetical protein